MRAGVRVLQPSRSRCGANGRLDTSKGERGVKKKMHPTFLGGVAKKRTAFCPLFWGGQGSGLADVGHLTDPGQTNGQGPVLFCGQSTALEDPGQVSGQGPVLFKGLSTALAYFEPRRA